MQRKKRITYITNTSNKKNKELVCRKSTFSRSHCSRSNRSFRHFTSASSTSSFVSSSESSCDWSMGEKSSEAIHLQIFKVEFRYDQHFLLNDLQLSQTCMLNSCTIHLHATTVEINNGSIRKKLKLKVFQTISCQSQPKST